MKPRTVAIYGGNLVMSAIGASLEGLPGFHVQYFAEVPSDTTALLNAAWPSVILFDLATAPADFAISLLRKAPTIMLIGVDLANNTLLVLSGERSRLLTAQDLVQVIEGSVPQATASEQR